MQMEKLSILILLLYLTFNISMEKPKQEDIPKSVIKGSGGIAVDLSSLNGKGKVLFADPRCFVIGLNDFPFMMFATPEFTEKLLPTHIQESIYGIKDLTFKPSFFVGKKHTPIKPCEISPWIASFKYIEYLQLENVNIDNLILLKELPVEHLNLKAVIYTNDTEVLFAIKQFKSLKEVSFDHSITDDLRHRIAALHLKTTLN
jgi:hypothetical protein